MKTAQPNPEKQETSMTSQASPDDSYETLSEEFAAAKMRVAQLKGWMAFAKLRDGVKAPKPARKARKNANGAGTGDASAELATFTDGENGAPQA